MSRLNVMNMIPQNQDTHTCNMRCQNGNAKNCSGQHTASLPSRNKRTDCHEHWDEIN